MAALLRSSKCVFGAKRLQSPSAAHAHNLGACSRLHICTGAVTSHPLQPALVPRQQQQRARQPCSPSAAAASDEPVSLEALRASSGSQKNLSFVAFWLQLALTLVSAGVLLFSVFITSGGSGNLALDVSKFFTLGGVLLSLISTFFAHGFLRLARKLASGGDVDVNWLSSNLLNNTTVNLVGIALTTIGLQASVGTLVGKTLMSAAQAPFQYNNTGALVSLDVFALQASTNILLCHLVGLAFANLMLRIVNKAMPKQAMT